MHRAPARRFVIGRSVLTTAVMAMCVGSAIPAGATEATRPATPPSLEWGACAETIAPDVECARLHVPLDWDRPRTSRTIPMAVAIHRATRDRIGTLTFNPGGPGGSGLSLLPFLLGGWPGQPGAALPREVIERFDIVAWDPRGVGASGPRLRGCTGGADFGDLPRTSTVDWTAVTRAWASSLAGSLADCIAANPQTAEHLGTASVIRDLDALRAALGEQTWSYYGISYGTTIGMAYARAYPERLRALVLDGVSPPSDSLVTSSAGYIWGELAAVRTFAAAYGSGFAHRLWRVITAADSRVITVGPGIELDRWGEDGFGGLAAVIFGLSGQSKYPSYKAFIDAAYSALRTAGGAGRSTRAHREQRPRAGKAGREFLLISLVMCSDRRDRPDLRTVAAMAEAAQAAGLTIAGLKVIERAVVCPGVPADFGTPLDQSTVPIRLPASALVVNSSADTRTQWLRARAAASQIRGARLITSTGTQHMVYRLVPSRCVNRPVTAYFLDLRLPPSDLECAFRAPRPLG